MSAAGTAVAGTTVAVAGTSVTAGTVAATHGLPFTGVNVGWEIIAAAVCFGVGGAIWRLIPRRTA
jgi:hypothetical protein